MAEFYDFVSATAPPVTTADMKSFLKISTSTDDVLIYAMLEAATEWGESYTRRSFRAVTWNLLLDEFADRICLRRDPVASVTHVKHLVDGAQVTVTASDYYLKKLTQHSEILLEENKTWPIDTDNREQAIEIQFVTESYYKADLIAAALKMHVAHWYRNRGDCADAAQAARDSGAAMIYDQFRVDRV